MTGVTHGADTERLRSIATELTGCAQRARDVAAMGNGSIGVLAQAWQGPDVEHFVHSWEGAGRSLEQAADRLQQTAEELRRQADNQTEGSTARATGGGGPGGGRGGVPDPTMAEPDGDDGDWDDPQSSSQPGLISSIIAGIDGVLLPPGLSITDPVVLELASSPEGIEVLKWLNANDVEISRGAPTTEYDPNDKTIYLEDDDPSSLVHEASHAKWDEEGKDASIEDDSREDYVNGQVDNEIEAIVASYDYLEATTDSNDEIDKPGYPEYREARDAALADGATPEEAQEAGRDRIRKELEEGSLVRGDNEEPYGKYYGDAWDRRHPDEAKEEDE